MKKKLIEKLSIIGVVAICAGVSIGQVVSSKISYDHYRNELEEAENNRVGNPVLDSIIVSKKEGVDFYKNGKASPSKDDFSVQANFTVKNGEDYSSNLTSKQFNMEVPSDFATNGGEITFKYLKKEAKLSVSLLDVKPVKLTVVNNPYIVVYKEGQLFNKDGLIICVEYNDGSTLDVDDSKINVDTTTPLKLTDKKWKLTYEFEGTTLLGEVDISVLKESEFTNGKLVSLEVKDGEAILFADEKRENADLSKLKIMGKYDSGNYIPVNVDDITIIGKEDIVSFGKKANLTICAKDNNNARIEIKAKVVKRQEAEKATITNGKVKTGSSYKYVNNEYIFDKEVSYVGDLNSSSKVEFNVNSKNNIRGKITLRVASTYLLFDNNNYHSEDILLSNLLNIKVNGYDKNFDHKIKIEKAGNTTNKDQPSQVYYDITLFDVLLSTGDNKITLEIKDSNIKSYDNSSASINLDYVDVEMLDDNNFSFGEYNETCDTRNIEKTYTTNKVYEGENVNVDEGVDAQGSCSDGEYIYIAVSQFGGGKTKIIKYDIETNNLVGKSELIEDGYTSGWVTDNYDINKLFYENGKIGYFDFNGKVSYFDTKTLSLLEKDITFTGASEKTIDAEYNNYLDQYVVVGKNHVGTFYKGNKKEKANETTIKFDVNNYMFRTITSDENYIYAVYRDNSESVTSTLIQTYTWFGQKVGEDQIIDCSNGLTKSDNRTVQSMVFAKGDVYFTGRAYTGHKGLFISKLNMSLDSLRTFDNSLLGGYVQNSMKNNVEPSFSNNLIAEGIISKGECDGATQTLFSVEGGCTDGQYLYYALASNGRQYVQIAKYDLSTKKIIQTTNVIKISDSKYWNEDYNMFYQNGYVYLLVKQTDVIKVFNSATLEAVENAEEFVFKNNGTKMNGIFSVGYSVEKNQYALAINNKLYITDKDKNVINTVTLKAEHTKDFFKDFEKNPDVDARFQTLYADNEYIYAIFNHDGWLAGEIQIFDWKGNKIKTVTIDLTINDKLQSAKGSYNVQNMVHMNGELYLGVLAYGGNTGLYIYQIDFN